MFKKLLKSKKSQEEIIVNRKADVLQEIIALAQERKQLKENLDELVEVDLSEIRRESEMILKEIGTLKKALEINDRKIEDNVILLEGELNVEDSGIYR